MKPGYRFVLTVGLFSACFTTMAQGQGQLSLYALVDVNLSRYTPGSAGGGSTTLLNDGHVNGLNGSRWGLRVAEELGDGLRAFATLEAGVMVDVGSNGQGGRGLGRQSFVGLGQRGLGEFRLGRQYLLSDGVVGESAPFGNGSVNNASTPVEHAAGNLPLFLNAPRVNNALQLTATPMKDYALAAQYAPGEGSNDAFHGMRAAHASDALYWGIAYEWNRARNTGERVNQSLTAAINLALGSTRVFAGAQRNSKLVSNSGNGPTTGISLTVPGAAPFTMNASNGWTLGAEVLWGQASFGLNYTWMQYEGSGGAKAQLDKWALGASYALSKRTKLYGGLARSGGSVMSHIQQAQVLQAGLRAAF